MIENNITTKTKKCRKCGNEKNLSEFRNQKASKDSKKAYCKPCDDIYQKKWYMENRQKRLRQVKDWQQKRKERNKGFGSHKLQIENKNV